MRKLYLFILFILLCISFNAQNDLTDKSLYHNTYVPDAVVDKQYGINMYEKLNMMLGGDTVRNDENGYAANGYEEDYYTTGQLLHKGYYVDGQLKVYKNYYPNGNVERNFRMTDLKKSKMTLYYEDGPIKSNIAYVNSEALKWEDYHKNGIVEYIEEYDKSFQYYVIKASYAENGNPRDVLELTNKKKLIYTQTYYHDNGKMKEQGEMKYDKAMFDYMRIGIWTLFDETEKPSKSQKYASGAVISEKNL